MFSLKKMQDKPSGTICHLLYKDVFICTFEEWAFQSCGVTSMYGMYRYPSFWTTETIDEFVKWLPNGHSEATHWCPQEVYFCITDSQAKSYLQALVTHPNVKLIDKFVNKAHGPNSMVLYRLSCKKDFPNEK